MTDRDLNNLLNRRLSPGEINLHFDGNWVITHVGVYQYDDSQNPPVRTPAQGIVIAYSPEHDKLLSDFGVQMIKSSNLHNTSALVIFQADKNNGPRILPRLPAPRDRTDEIADTLEKSLLYRRLRRTTPGFRP